MGSKSASGIVTLMFLAIWHGFSFSYFGAFALEFVDMEVFEPLLQSVTNRLNYHSRFAKYTMSFVLHCATWALMGFGVVTFDLLTWSRVSQFWHATRYWNFIAVAFLLVVSKIYRMGVNRYVETTKSVKKVQ